MRGRPAPGRSCPPAGRATFCGCAPATAQRPRSAGARSGRGRPRLGRPSATGRQPSFSSRAGAGPAVTFGERVGQARDLRLLVFVGRFPARGERRARAARAPRPARSTGAARRAGRRRTGCAPGHDSRGAPTRQASPGSLATGSGSSSANGSSVPSPCRSGRGARRTGSSRTPSRKSPSARLRPLAAGQRQRQLRIAAARPRAAAGTRRRSAGSRR